MEETNFIKRQNNLLSAIEEGIVIIPGAGLRQKSHDTEFPFRQNSDFKYFTGFNEPDATLVLKKSKEGAVESHLFLQEKNPEMEMWTGIRLGSEKAPEVLPVDHAYPNHEFSKRLPELFRNHQNLYYNFFNQDLQKSVTKTLQSLGGKRKEKFHSPLHWHHLSPLIGMLRLRKDKNEILAMKQAANLTNIGHRAAMALAKPGVNEKEIDQLLNYLFSQENGEGTAYDSIVAGGKNALILHYINNNQILNDGDLVLIDAGAQVNTYAGDVTRTFPVNGKYTQAQKDLYQVVLDSQKLAMGHMKIGATLKEIHTSTCQALLKSMMDAQILKGSFDELWEKDAYRAYYPHGTGHWLGLDVHDQSPYLDDDLNEITLDEGMVFTCEPGLYFPEGDSNIPKEWQGMGIRIEDDILITQSGPENLTRSIPKEVKEVEDACNEDIRSILEKLSSPSLLS